MKFFLSLLITLVLSTTLFGRNSIPDSVYVINDSVLIPTRSGVDISAIIVCKKANTQPLPAVLFYTTYISPNDAALAKKSAARDYITIVAYARGIRTNLDNYMPYEHEPTDVYDIIDWISKQAWCSGKVGMYGGSYTGYSQWATAKNIHPALKTIVPQVAVMPGFDMPMENNVQTNNSLNWAYDNIYKTKQARRSLPFEWFEAGTSYRSIDSLAGIPNTIFRKWMEHPAYDTYWEAMVPTPEEYSQINIPVLSTTGYYDGAQIGALRYLRLHTKYNKNADHYFVIGPYDHWGGQRKPAANLMGYSIDPVAEISMEELAFQWLDYILKNKPKPALLKNKINYQVMGTNVWKHAASLDEMNTDTLTFYLSTATSGNVHLLSAIKPEKVASLAQRVDFKDRTSENNFFTPAIVFDTLDASNGLIFRTEPFKSDFSVNGSFSGLLYTTINKKDLDISMALYEQTPDGKYFFLTRYIGRASYAGNSSKRQLLSPGKKESIAFTNTKLVCKKISTGSRLVILLNTNKHPFEIINYGSGKEVADESVKDAGEPLQIKWHNDSFIKIPVAH